MPLWAKRPESTYTPPPEGLYHAVCADVIDLGLQTTKWGQRHLVELVWQLAETNDQGRRYTVRKRYTLSLHEKSQLRRDLESWRGRKFTDKEAIQGFDVEALVGVNCQVQIVHNLGTDGKTYANVHAVVPPPRHAVPLIPQDYTRRAMMPADTEAVEDDDAVPF